MKFQINHPEAGYIQWYAFLLVVFIICFIESIIIPPLQSPDEHDHLKRAYLLSQGRFIMDAPPGKMSGGMIDMGLNQYIDEFYKLHNSPDMRLNRSYLEASKEIRWTGVKAFTNAPGTGFYFPLSYTPQALGLWLGETMDLTVDISCKLARILSLVTTIGIIAFAFRIYCPSALTMSLMALPMTLFQLSTAGLDGISMALEVLALSLFMIIIKSGHNVPSLFMIGLNLCIILLTSSRVHLLPLLALPFVTAYRTQNRMAWFLPLLSSSLVFIWIIIAIKTTVDMRVDVGAPLSTIIFYYLNHPLAFINVVFMTLTAPDTLPLYTKSFIGILGWLDAWLAVTDYKIIGLFLIGLLGLSVFTLRSKPELKVAGLMIMLSAFSVALIFFALLITWNKHPAHFISGIQGRYFMAPALLVSYGLSYSREVAPWCRNAGSVTLIALVLYSTYATTVSLLGRYWLVSN